VESLVTDGKIVVNGKVCTDLAMQITEDQDIVQYSGKELKRKQDKIYIILNKPAGFVVSAQDEYSRKTVYDLLPEKYANLPYAGRLDKGSEGLLLFTNDGELIKQLTHPSHKVLKSYRVDIDKKLSHNDLIRLRNGVEIEGGITQKAEYL
jgi:23S rRNA pseudouridine2605 synthase